MANVHETIQRARDRWDDFFYEHEALRRVPWRTAQIAIAGQAFFLTAAHMVTHEPSLAFAAFASLTTIPVIETNLVERKGYEATGFQYLWGVLAGRQALGYEEVPFGQWIGIVNKASGDFLPPGSKDVEQGYCTWREYLHFNAYYHTELRGNDPKELARALLKSLSM